MVARPLQRITSDKYCRRDGGTPTRLDDVAVLAVRYPNDSRWDCEAFFVDPIMNAVRGTALPRPLPHCRTRKPHFPSRPILCLLVFSPPSLWTRAFCQVFIIVKIRGSETQVGFRMMHYIIDVWVHRYLYDSPVNG